MKDETTIGNSQYLLKAIHELLDERLPKRHVGERGPELMPVQEGTVAWAARERAKGEAGEPVEPGDLRAGDRVEFTFNGERLIERAPREDSDERVRVYVEMVERAEKAERRVDELEPALARSETERDEWKADAVARKRVVDNRGEQIASLTERNVDLTAERDEWKARYKALRGDVHLLSIRATTALETRPKLRAILDRDDERTPQASPDTVTLRRDDVAALLRFWEFAGGNGVVRDIPRRVRAALGWGDGDGT